MGSLSWLWGKALWLNRPMLTMLIVVNGLGTIYGYYWYKNQLVATYEHYPLILLPFVPDSPTASLFFTLALCYLLMDLRKNKPRRPKGLFRGIVEAMAVVTSIKYGVWAVAMIFAGNALGNTLGWQDWMLTTSHLAMVVEAILFARFFGYGKLSLWLVACWILLNDALDYGVGIFPYLSRVLHPYLGGIALFTVGLSFASLLVAYQSIRARK